MKKIRRLFLLASAFVFAIALASCSTQTPINTSVPTGNLNLQETVVSAGGDEIKNDLFYTRLRANGYDTVLNNIKKDLYAEEYAYVATQINSDNTINDYEEELFNAYASEFLQTTDPEKVKGYTDEELDTLINRYIDTCYNRGIVLTKESLFNSFFTTEKNIGFTYIPEEIKAEKLINVAMNKASKDALEKIVDEEKIEDEDGKMVTNSNYISEDNIKNYFESTTRTYGTYQAIVVQFNNLTEAQDVIRRVEAQVGALTDDNALNFYVTLYNTYYNYRPKQLSISNPFTSDTKTEFVVNEDKDELNDISSSIKSVITNTLDEDDTYLNRPFNQNYKYVMVYRGKTTYEINEKYNFPTLNEQLEWSDIVGNPTALNEIKDHIKEKLTESKVSSYINKVFQDRIDEAQIEIYDPYFEYRFLNSYDDYYDRISPDAFDNENIYKLTYNNQTSFYSVADFYVEQSALSGLTIIVDLVKYNYVYHLKDRYLTSDRIQEMTDEVNSDVDAFTRNEKETYNSNLGEELYLLISYGYSTREDVIKYNKVSSSLLTSYLSETVFSEWAKVNEDGSYPDTHDIDYDKLNILKNILEAGNANYSNLFSINIDHILIYLDDDSDGNPDDPKDFLEDFTEAQKKAFDTALLELAQAIYNEANCETLTHSNNIMEILNHVVTAYSKNESLYSDPTKTWADYKKYNFLLKVESLSSSGDTTQSNVTNYVEEFADYVKALYKTASENNVVINENKPIFYFKESKENAPSSMEDICSTEFGFHMLIVNSWQKPSTTRKTSTSDTYGYYKNINILLDEKDADTTDDNIYVIVPDVYNEDDKKETMATINQLFTYYVQLQKGISSSLDSTLRDVLSSMFSESITKYTSTAFQNYLLFKEIPITTNNSLLSRQLENYAGYLERLSRNYDTEDDTFDSWYDDSLDWSRPYNVIE